MCVWVYGDYCWKAESRKKQEKLFPSLSEYLYQYVYLSVCISDVCFSANVSLSAWEKKARALLEAHLSCRRGRDRRLCCLSILFEAAAEQRALPERKSRTNLAAPKAAGGCAQGERQTEGVAVCCTPLSHAQPGYNKSNSARQGVTAKLFASQCTPFQRERDHSFRLKRGHFRATVKVLITGTVPVPQGRFFSGRASVSQRYGNS